MAYYRAQDGSANIGSTAIGQVEGWSLSTSVEILDTTVMGVAWRTNTTGLGEWSGSINVKIDLGDTEQAAIFAQIIASSPATSTLSLVLLISATKTFSGTANIKSVAVTSQLSQIVKATIGFTGSAALSSAWS